jgi:hypothetical protein
MFLQTPGTEGFYSLFLKFSKNSELWGEDNGGCLILEYLKNPNQWWIGS